MSYAGDVLAANEGLKRFARGGSTMHHTTADRPVPTMDVAVLGDPRGNDIVFSPAPKDNSDTDALFLLGGGLGTPAASLAVSALHVREDANRVSFNMQPSAAIIQNSVQPVRPVQHYGLKKSGLRL